jgi:uncharacterized membrane protein (UPF0127 family)
MPFGRVLLVAVLAGGPVVVACSDSTSRPTPAETSTDRTNPPATTAPGTTVTSPVESIPEGVRPEGFSTVTARITDADGEVCEVCVWLADAADERARGLMGVTDLGDAVGMAFRFDDPVTNRFYMLNTPTPLSIAWFAPGGEYVASTDMEPCLEVPEDGCPLYGPGASYDLALEVFQGDLDDLGVGPGARLELVAGTEADRCPTRG